jgi:hypothetical protein
MANPTSGSGVNPLDQLRDIHLPDPVSWWPMAPGWWFLILACGLLSAALCRFIYRRYKARLYRRQALKKLKNVQLSKPSQQQLRDLLELLKQTANSAYPNRKPGSQSSEQFIHFLQYSCDKPLFDSLNIDLEKALYSDSKQISGQLDELFDDAEIWIKQHVSAHKLEPSQPC